MGLTCSRWWVNQQKHTNQLKSQETEEKEMRLQHLFGGLVWYLGWIFIATQNPDQPCVRIHHAPLPGNPRRTITGPPKVHFIESKCHTSKSESLSVTESRVSPSARSPLSSGLHSPPLSERAPSGHMRWCCNLKMKRKRREVKSGAVRLNLIPSVEIKYKLQLKKTFVIVLFLWKKNKNKTSN